jgi:dTDP-4-dehydrorhamnose reductase
MLGLDLVASIDSAGYEVVPLPRAELDITDATAVLAAIDRHHPDVVINAAAYTKVDGAQDDEATAQAVNGDGAGNLAAAAAENGAWIIHVSTDYVFDGTKTGAGYVESDRVNPASAYGRTKLGGELLVAAQAPDSHTIVRSSWLFGTGGPCFPKTIMRVARERGALKVVDDQIGCPTYTGHLADALVRIAATADRPIGVTHIAAAGRCSWFEFARAIVTGAAIECELTPCTTEEYPLPAPRPAFSVLESEREDGVPRLSAWEQGLTEFLQKEMT